MIKIIIQTIILFEQSEIKKMNESLPTFTIKLPTIFIFLYFLL